MRSWCSCANARAIAGSCGWHSAICRARPVVAVPNRAIRAQQDLHHRRVRAEREPSRKELRGRGAAVAAGIGTDHRIHDPAEPQELLQRVRHAGETGAGIPGPDGDVLARPVVDVPAEREPFRSQDVGRGVVRRLRGQDRQFALQRGRHLALLSAVDLEAAHAALHEVVPQPVLEVREHFRPAQIQPRRRREVPLEPVRGAEDARGKHRIGEHRVVGAVGDPPEQVHVAAGQVGNHLVRVRKPRGPGVEVEVAPAAEAAAAGAPGPVEPDGRRGNLQTLQVVRILLHEVLRVGDAVGGEVGVMVVAPPDHVEGPERRHQRAARQLVVAREHLRIRGPVDHVVGQRGRVEAEARALLHRDGGAAERERVGVHAVLA